MPTASTAIASAGAALLARVAGALARSGVRPNHLTVAGFVVTLAAALALVPAGGRAHPWAFVAGATLLVAALLDLLDGAVARAGGTTSAFGAFLDSTLDRAGEAALYTACAVHFAWVGNVTWVLLSVAALAASLLVSYTKARAEGLGAPGAVGFWQRSERLVVLIAAALLARVPAALLLLGTLPWLTVLRRMRYTAAVLGGEPPAPLRSQRTSLLHAIAIVLLLGHLFAWPWINARVLGADPVRGCLSPSAS
jgi:CDP-diacylglycerol--glycerol-3-phosphate 3-phosphatidyltransferase